MLVLLFVGLIAGIFLWQKLYNPGELCAECYRVLPPDARECPWCGESVGVDMERAGPTQVTNVINIQDSVISRSTIGTEGEADVKDSIAHKSKTGKK